MSPRGRLQTARLPSGEDGGCGGQCPRAVVWAPTWISRHHVGMPGWGAGVFNPCREGLGLGRGTAEVPLPSCLDAPPLVLVADAWAQGGFRGGVPPNQLASSVRLTVWRVCVILVVRKVTHLGGRQHDHGSQLFLPAH